MSGTTILTSARVLQNVTANASIITAGTLSGDRIMSGDKIQRSQICLILLGMTLWFIPVQD